MRSRPRREDLSLASVESNFVEYSEGLDLGGRTASVWTPGSATPKEPLGAYRLRFSTRKLLQSTVGLPFGAGPLVTALPAAKHLLCSSVPSTVSRRSVVLVHGLLCTRFDLAHVAEALAAKGFTAVAPEMDDSVSHDEGVAPGGFVGAVLLGREEAEARRRSIVSDAVAWLRSCGAETVGLVGHSRGGVTVSQMQGRFCRVNMAGFLPPPVDPRENFHPSAAEAPLLVICGEDDEVCARGPLSLELCQQTVGRLVPRAETWYPPNVGHFALLDPRVVEQWRARMGPFGPVPPNSAFTAKVVERVVSFLDMTMS